MLTLRRTPPDDLPKLEGLRLITQFVTVSYDDVLKRNTESRVGPLHSQWALRELVEDSDYRFYCAHEHGSCAHGGARVLFEAA